MNLAYQNLLPADFDPASRVWIYQSSRVLTIAEALETESMLEHFTGNWQSHGSPVKGFATLFFGRFLIFMADETATGVSGCSTDSSVRLVKQLEQKFGLSLFDRQTLAFLRNGKVELLPLGQLGYAIQNGFLDADSLYFNNLVQTKAELENNWIIPLKNSWLANKLPAGV